MATPSSLLGPPEIYRQPTTTVGAGAASTTTGIPFIDQMVTNFNKIATAPPPPAMGYTENASLTFLSTGNPCLDFFFHVVPNTPPETLTLRLKSAWDHNPLTALKLVCNLRGVRGTGKFDKEEYYTAALWLHKNHPKTLACNVWPLAEFGYFKDLPEILYRLLEGPEVRREAKAAWMARKSGGKTNIYRGRRNSSSTSTAGKPTETEIKERIKRLSLILADKGLVSKLPDNGYNLNKQIAELNLELEMIHKAKTTEKEVIDCDDIAAELQRVL